MTTERFRRWTHFAIDDHLPGEGWGTGGIAVGDFTGLGEANVAISRRDTLSAYWYRRHNDGEWSRHVVGQSEHLARTLGAAVLDIDGDGRPDIVFSHVWFRNPGGLVEKPNTPWPANEWPGSGHDMVVADIDSDGRDDLVTYDGRILAWFDPAEGLQPHVILDDRDEHGGVAPRGIGDLNGNGRPDIVLPGIWLENPGDGRGEWKRHPWPYEAIPGASYGPSIRSWVVDLNGNGWNDIVYADCDSGFCHVWWVENLGEGKKWIRHRLPDPPGNPQTGSFHSLCVADFDGDGHLEIFAGEQEDASTSMKAQGLLPMKPEGLKERGVIWVNTGGDTPVFEPVVIHEGRPGWHDATLVDVNDDGAVDIITKVWNTDWNDGEENYHLDYWRNDIRAKE